MAGKTVWALGMLLSLAASASAETIVSHETEKFFYKNGEMERYDGQFENTYHYDPEKNTLVRTRVYDYRTKQITPDETVYRVQTQLDSFPTRAAEHGVPPTIKAYGEPDGDSAEVLMIEGEFVHSLKASGSQVMNSSTRVPGLCCSVAAIEP